MVYFNPGASFFDIYGQRIKFSPLREVTDKFIKRHFFYLSPSKQINEDQDFHSKIGAGATKISNWCSKKKYPLPMKITPFRYQCLKMKLDQSDANIPKYKSSTDLSYLILNKKMYVFLSEIHKKDPKSVSICLELPSGEPVVVTKNNKSKLKKEYIEIIKDLTKINQKGILPILDECQIDDSQFLILKWCEKGDLFDVVYEKEEVVLAEASKKIIAHDIMEGLHALSAKGLSYCDLKPENIFIDSDFEAYLGDLESIQKKGDPNYKTQTLLFSPPEAFLSQFEDYNTFGKGESMTWSLGLVFYWLFSGKAAPLYLSLDRFFEHRRPLEGAKLLGWNSFQSYLPWRENPRTDLEALISKMFVVKPEDRIGFDEAYTTFNQIEDHQVRICAT